MDHDGIHKLAYRHRELFGDLVRLLAPALAKDLDLRTAEELPAAHVGAGNDGLRQRYGDMAWRLPFKSGRLKDGSLPYLLAPVEFQSTVDRQMGERMRTYGAMLRSRAALQGAVEREGGMPWLLPIVVYNGTEPWTATGQGTDLARVPTARAWRALALYQGRDYVLLSLQQLLAAGGLDGLPLPNRAAATLRLQAAETPEGLVRQLRAEWLRFPGATNAGTRQVLRVWAAALLADKAGDEGVGLLSTLAEMEGETKMTTISQARLGKWFDDFYAKVERGREQGMAQGREQERLRSLALLQRQAAMKFGSRTAERMAATLDAAPTAAQMERVGALIIECDDGEELLASLYAASGDGNGEG